MISRTLTPILSIIVAVMIAYFFILPKYETTQLVRAEIQEYETAVEKYNEFSNKLDEKLAIKTERPAIDNEHLDTLVPSEIDDTQLLVDLETLVTKQTMLFGNISIKGNTTIYQQGSEADTSSGQQISRQLVSLDISFDVIGSYEQFQLFLSELERSRTLYEVVSLSYTPSESAFQQFSLTVRVYALPKM